MAPDPSLVPFKAGVSGVPVMAIGCAEAVGRAETHQGLRKPA